MERVAMHGILIHTQEIRQYMYNPLPVRSSPVATLTALFMHSVLHMIFTVSSRPSVVTELPPIPLRVSNRYAHGNLLYRQAHSAFLLSALPAVLLSSRPHHRRIYLRLCTA